MRIEETANLCDSGRAVDSSPDSGRAEVHNVIANRHYPIAYNLSYSNSPRSDMDADILVTLSPITILRQDDKKYNFLFNPV